jgi:transposase
MPHLSLAEKLRVVILLKEGWSEKRVAVRFNIARSTVHNIKTVWNERQSFERPIAGDKPKVSTDIEDVNLIQILRENPFISVIVSRKNRKCEIILQSKNLF